MRTPVGQSDGQGIKPVVEWVTSVYEKGVKIPSHLIPSQKLDACDAWVRPEKLTKWGIAIAAHVTGIFCPRLP